MGNDQKEIKLADKTLSLWFMGILLLIVICVATPAIFPSLSWMYLLFPAGVVTGSIALMIFDHRMSHGKPPEGEKQIRE
jgi:hypothetical protein